VVEAALSVSCNQEPQHRRCSVNGRRSRYTEVTVAEGLQRGEVSRTQLDVPQGNLRIGVKKNDLHPRRSMCAHREPSSECAVPMETRG